MPEHIKSDSGGEDRMFVRGINGEYNLSEELRRLRALPRVHKGIEVEFTGGPQHWNKDYMIPATAGADAPHPPAGVRAGGSRKNTGTSTRRSSTPHGEGTEVHDGIAYNWEAGDIAIVHNNCVHEHFNRSTTKPARCLVMKTKPMFLFMNMMFQKTIKRQTAPPVAPAGVGWVPREDAQYSDHAVEHEHLHATEPNR